MQQSQWPTTPNTFLALPPEEHNVSNSQVVILPVPYDAASSYKAGARDGPNAILRASREMEDFDAELSYSPCDIGIATVDAVEPHAGGPELMSNRVAQVMSSYFAQNKLVCMLGGDHSLTTGAVRAAKQHYPDLSVLVFDAHTDLADEYQGSKFSHACTVRRIHERTPAVLTGVRSISQEANDYLNQTSLPIFPRNSEPITDTPSIIAGLSRDIYISIDLDVFDPSIMAAVGNPEPGGMGWWEILRILREVTKHRNLIGFDIMELAPSEGPEACSFTAARLVYKLIAYGTYPAQNLRQYS